MGLLLTGCNQADPQVNRSIRTFGAILSQSSSLALRPTNRYSTQGSRVEINSDVGFYPDFAIDQNSRDAGRTAIQMRSTRHASAAPTAIAESGIKPANRHA